MPDNFHSDGGALKAVQPIPGFIACWGKKSLLWGSCCGAAGQGVEFIILTIDIFFIDSLPKPLKIQVLF
ncbi:MAG: hypothetical protein B6D73_09640 [gamma proteobacterium symbiont of Stewartia floridana]|nr:MAG: hypothetical protein B6D73_09640 [gamma proteobacterium symbiont of Stewartia floridana]